MLNLEFKDAIEREIDDYITTEETADIYQTILKRKKIKLKTEDAYDGLF